MKKKIEEFKKSESCNDASVKEYSFQNQNVFVFDPGTCGADMTSAVIDCDCNVMGYLGGISGNQTIKGEDFGHAKFIQSH